MKIVIYTTISDPKWIQDTKAMGVSDYLQPTLKPEEIISRIDKVLNI